MSGSAAGLFRATGKAPKPVAVRDLVTGDIVKSAGGLEREKDDFYPTPPEPTLAFLSAEKSALSRFPHLWESAAGDGAMARLLQDAGHTVTMSDMVERGCGADIRSFYDFDTAPAQALVTNPPFAECNSGRWITHALDTLGVLYMALLLPVNWMGAKTRGPLWQRHQPARVYLMRWRIDFTGQGAPPMLNAWFIWDDTHKGPTELHMLDRVDSRQGELLAEDAA